MKNTRYYVIFAVFVVLGFLIAAGARNWSLSGNSTTNLSGATISEEEIYDTGINAQSNPSIDNPSFVSIASADTILADEVEGIIVPAGDVARFYSYQILNWHEVVNETIGDQKLAVTHCVLCHSSAVYDRVVDGQELHFEISGLVYNNNTLLQDRETGSLWLQATGEAISGELQGKQLTRVAAPVMTWESFKEAFPSAEALSTDTGFTMDYARHPYMNYDVSETIYFPVSTSDNRMVNKWLVNGVEINGEYLAVGKKIIENDPVQMDEVGGETIVAMHDTDFDVTSVFKPVTSEGQNLTFTFDFDEQEIRDEETGSLWTAYGLATEGELAGERLEEVPTSNMFWFCWVSLHPETRVNQLDT